MPKRSKNGQSYTPEFKEMIVGLMRAGASARQIASRYNIYPSTVEAWWVRYGEGLSPVELAKQDRETKELESHPQLLERRLSIREFSENSDMALDEKIDRLEDMMIEGITIMVEELPNKVKHASLSELFAGIDNMSTKVVAMVKARTVRELATNGTGAASPMPRLGDEESTVGPDGDQSKLIDAVHNANRISRAVLDAAQRQVETAARMAEEPSPFAQVPIREKSPGDK